jgi:hypothetical protein
MTPEELLLNCQFPSNSPDNERQELDLGRFGLGMKTASFSQTRKFTVLSRKKNTNEYSGLTWDVEFIRETKAWTLIENSQEEIESLLKQHNTLNKSFIQPIKNFLPNTIIIWFGLYKFEDYLSEKNRAKTLHREISTNVAEHLGIVFHRFIEKRGTPLSIRVNNALVAPFNPFPESHRGFRSVEYKQKKFGDDLIRLEGFVLPSVALDEVKSEQNIWSTSNKSLIDMEGVYVYRADRLILYGGWNGLIKKFPRLQLARLRVDIGNSVDHLLHLNVAKSAVIIPHDLKDAFEGYIRELTVEATREYYNRGVRKFPEKKQNVELELFNKIHTNKGPKVEVNNSYPLVKLLRESLNDEQEGRLNLLLRLFNNSVNKIRDSEARPTHFEIDTTNEVDSLVEFVMKAKELGFSNDYLKTHLHKSFGISEANLPANIKKLMELQ